MSTTDGNQSLEEYKKKREEWLVCLRGPDVTRIAVNTILYQIVRFTWRACVFHIVQTAITVAPKNEQGYAELNGEVFELFRANHAVAQMAAIRRLIDPQNEDPRKGVYSLRGLVDDICNQRHLVTRFNIFASEGIEYDVQKVDAAYREWRTENVDCGRVPPELETRPVLDRHDFVDRISGADPANRRGTDAILRSLLDGLKKKLDSCKAVKEHVDKYIAHAATQESRTSLSTEGENPTWDQLDDAIKEICNVAAFLLELLKGNGEFLWVEDPPAGWEQYIDRPLVTPDNVPKLAAAWEEFSEKAQSWSKWNWGALVEEPKRLTVDEMKIIEGE